MGCAVAENDDHVSLPSRRQLACLRDFLHDRVRSAGAAALRSEDESAPAEGSSEGDARHAERALTLVVNLLSRRVLDAVYAGDADDAARYAWELLQAIAREWHDSPEMPHELRELVRDRFRR